MSQYLLCRGAEQSLIPRPHIKLEVEPIPQRFSVLGLHAVCTEPHGIYSDKGQRGEVEAGVLAWQLQLRDP